MACRLILNADDLAQSSGINEGIFLAHRDGILTSASIMATGHAFEHALSLCRINPSLDLGIHLALVEEQPLSAPDSIPSLISDSGRMHSDHVTFVSRYYRGKIDLNEVRIELDTQIQRVLSSKLAISHINGHQHLHMLPGILAVVIELARKYGVQALRIPRERCRAYMLREAHRTPGRLMQLLALNSLCATTKVNNLITTDHFVGFFYGGRMNSEHLKKVIRHLPSEGTCELMCHPGVEVDPSSKILGGYDRRPDLEALLDPEVTRIMQDAGIEPISYRELVANKSGPDVQSAH